jgi:hypothetical protein
MLARGPLLWIGVLGTMWMVLAFAWTYGSIDRAKEHAQATYAKYTHKDGISETGNSTLGVSVHRSHDRVTSTDLD